MPPRKKTDTIQLSKIRMSEDLRRKLAREAEKNGATLNGEIVARLEESFRRAELQTLLNEHQKTTVDMIAKLILNGPNAGKADEPANQPGLMDFKPEDPEK